jgi:hypothetical protein
VPEEAFHIQIDKEMEQLRHDHSEADGGMTESLFIEYRSRRLWAFTAAVWLANYLPSRVGFALARIVACLVVIIEFRMGPCGVWRRVAADEYIEYGVG